MTEENTRTEVSPVTMPGGGESARSPLELRTARPKRKYRRAEPVPSRSTAFVELECKPVTAAVPPARHARVLPDPQWTAEFIAALVVHFR